VRKIIGTDGQNPKIVYRKNEDDLVSLWYDILGFNVPLDTV